MIRPFDVPDASFIGQYRYAIINQHNLRFYWVIFDANKSAKKVFWGRPIAQGQTRSYALAKGQVMQSVGIRP